MTEPEIDIDTFRRTRAERFRIWLSEVVSGVTHFRWPKTTATVVTCRPVKISRYHSPSRYVPYRQPLLTGYIVEFSYSVEGRIYTGALDSPVEVQPSDCFNIRYNPARPEENNSLSSNGDTGSQMASIMMALLVVAISLGLLIHLVRLYFSF